LDFDVFILPITAQHKQGLSKANSSITFIIMFRNFQRNQITNHFPSKKEEDGLRNYVRPGIFLWPDAMGKAWQRPKQGKLASTTHR
jgi:hypothetical protein